jgi:hypothetical protein
MDPLCNPLSAAVWRDLQHIYDIRAKRNQKDTPAPRFAYRYCCPCRCEHHILANDIRLAEVRIVVWFSRILYNTDDMVIYMLDYIDHGECIQYFAAKDTQTGFATRDRRLISEHRHARGIPGNVRDGGSV